jgi:hypothetical protein
MRRVVDQQQQQLTLYQRKLLARSDRVKSVDFHPTEPHVICGL